MGRTFKHVRNTLNKQGIKGITITQKPAKKGAPKEVTVKIKNQAAVTFAGSDSNPVNIERYIQERLQSEGASSSNSSSKKTRQPEENHDDQENQDDHVGERVYTSTKKYKRVQVESDENKENEAPAFVGKGKAKAKPRLDYDPKLSRLKKPQRDETLEQVVAEYAKHEDIAPNLAQSVVVAPPVVHVEPPTVPVVYPHIDTNVSGLLPTEQKMDQVVTSPKQETDAPRPIAVEDLPMADAEEEGEPMDTDPPVQNFFQQNNAFIQNSLLANDPNLTPVINNLAQQIQSSNVTQEEANRLFKEGLAELYQQSIKNGAKAVDVVDGFMQSLREDIHANNEAVAQQAEAAAQQAAVTQQGLAAVGQQVTDVQQEIKTYHNTVREAMMAGGGNQTKQSAARLLQQTNASLAPDGRPSDPDDYTKILKDIRALLTTKSRDSVDPDDISVPTAYGTVPRYRKNRFIPPRNLQVREHVVYPHGAKSVKIAKGQGVQGTFN